MLRIHTDSALKLSGLLWSQCSLKDIVVTLVAHHLQWLDREDTLLALLINMYVHLLECYSILQSLLVNHVADGVLLCSLDTGSRIIPLGANHVDGIPALSHGLLPLSQILGQLVVVLAQSLKALSLLVVELLVVVVKLSLHGVVRSNLSNRVLDYLHPTL